MFNFLRDLNYAFRTLCKAPAAAGVAIFALAAGIGVNVSAFIVVNGVLLHPMPFANLERIQTIWQNNPQLHLDRSTVSPADFLDLQRQAASFESLAACRSVASTLKISGGSEAVRTAEVSPAFFTVLSGKAARGRVITKDVNAVVVSDAFWKTRLAGAPDVLGKSLTLSTGTVTIVGVMPDQFDYPLGTEVWSPLVLTPAESQQRNTHSLQLLGLLKPGATLNQAAAEVSSLSTRLASAYPATNSNEAFTVIPLQDLTEGTTNRFVSVILGAACFVLLLACANIGNLQLARATNRQKEIAVRAALGASRFQIARGLLAESLLLSVLAGFLAVLLADWNNVYTKQNIPAIAMRVVPGLRTMSVDPSVLFFALCVSVIAGVLCSLPAILHLVRRASHDNLEESLRERAALASQHSSGAFRGSLVVSELALALVLLIGAGLMVGTFHRLLDLNQGFDPKGILSARVSLQQAAYLDTVHRLSYFDRALTSLRTLPGVSAAALSADLGKPNFFAIGARSAHRSGEPVPNIIAASGLYLSALRIPVLEGRGISIADTARSTRVIVLSKTFAQFYWPNTSALGQRIQLAKGGEWFKVVGVSGDVIQDWFAGTPASLAYVSYAQLVPTDAEFAVRTVGNPLALAPPVRTQLQSLDPAVPLLDVTSLEQALAEERSGVRAAARTMSTYAGIALLLAITGIYAVVSFLVSMRTRDLGIHIALGATGADILKMMTRQTGQLIVLGVGGGLFLSLVLTRIMSHMLFEVVQLDAALWFMLTAGLLAAALLAAYLPALRATHIDPVNALRQE
jgi:putative ABC transport system permease protein